MFLRSFEGGDTTVTQAPGPAPTVESAAPRETGIGQEQYQDASAQELHAAGLELLGLWHIREATELFERAVASDSTYYPAWVSLIECYAHPLVGREDDAGGAYEQAATHRVSDSDTTFLDGLRNLFIDRDDAAASAILTRAEKLEVSHGDAEYYTALALYRSGRTGEARAKLEDILRKDETVGRVMELSIRCAAADGDAGTAGDRARELARMYAEEPYPYVLLALVELTLGNEQNAVEFCNNALVLDSKYIPAILARGNLYAAAGEFEAARVSFEKLLMFDDPVLRAWGFEGIGYVDFLSGRFNAGVDGLDEAIRHAMLAGAVRQGLTMSSWLVGYLCELGQKDPAKSVVDRWVTGFGEVPVGLGMLRIQLLEGEREATMRVLEDMQSSKDWAAWMGVMSIDFTEMLALVHIGEREYGAALEILARNAGTGAFQPATHTFLRGYAAFQNGDAESASEALAETGRRLYGVEFPYHGDAVLYVQSLFYLAEAALASGLESEAIVRYEIFLDYWGDSDWDIQAVARAREKLESLTSSTAP
jgi:tetratricopeptide (TPR) repeat protein